MARRRIVPLSPLRVVGYVRVSTEDQSLGPEAQRAALEAWCHTHGAELTAVHQDLGVSGATPLEKRPALLAALDDLRARAAGVLLVAKRDRLARDVVGAAMIERLTERQGSKVLTADGIGNGDSPEAQLLRGMVDVFAQYERALIRTRTRAALAVKKGKGERVGRIPYGWRLASDGLHLIEDETEQSIIRVVHRLRDAGHSFAEIEAELERQGIVGRSGKRIGHSQAHRILQRGEAA